MSKQIQDAYIVAATRTPVAKRGMFRNVRGRHAGPRAAPCVARCRASRHRDRRRDRRLRHAGAEQGMNVARIGVLLAGCPTPCRASPSTASARPACRPVADAAARIRLGEADVMIAAGTESMT
jgi:acetyl-CoA acyltransferase